jgi:hypothetical protein
MDRTVLRWAYALGGAGLSFERRTLDVVSRENGSPPLEPVDSVSEAEAQTEIERPRWSVRGHGGVGGAGARGWAIPPIISR